MTLGGLIAKKGRKKNTPVIAEQQHFKYYYKKREEKKICKVQHIKGAKENKEMLHLVPPVVWLLSFHLKFILPESRCWVPPGVTLTIQKTDFFFFDQSQMQNPPAKKTDLLF